MIMRCIKQLSVLFVSLVLMSGIAYAQDKQAAKPLKDKTVKTLMKYALSLMPEVYTGPDGKKISINKKKPEEVLIPLEDASRIIVVGHRSAKAQNCDLKVMQTLNHNAMVKYETVFKNWTDTQKLFINQLHLFTVLYMTGNVKFEDETEKTSEPAKRPKDEELQNKYKCSDEERQQVSDSVDAYLENVKKLITEELKRRKKLGSNEKKNDEIKKAQK